MSMIGKGPFWAGGTPDGWFVKFHKEPDCVPGRSSDILIRWFDSRDFANGETGAAHVADALAADLNAAFAKAETSA